MRGLVWTREGRALSRRASGTVKSCKVKNSHPKQEFPAELFGERMMKDVREQMSSGRIEPVVDHHSARDDAKLFGVPSLNRPRRSPVTEQSISQRPAKREPGPAWQQQRRLFRLAGFMARPKGGTVACMAITGEEW